MVQPGKAGTIFAVMCRGVSLVELVLVLTLVGVVLLLAVPGFGALRDRAAVRAAASAITTAHARASAVARTERRLAVLHLTADSIVLRVVAAPGDTIDRWWSPGPAGGGVTAAGLPRTVLFAPSGVTMGVANATYSLVRGNFRRQVIVSRYGRVRTQ